MFDWALNIPLHMYKLSNNISFCCNTKQLQKGRNDTSFFTHLNREQSPLQVLVNMYSFRLTSYAPHQSTANLLPWSTFISNQPGMVFDHLVLMLCPMSNQHHTLKVNYGKVILG